MRALVLAFVLAVAGCLAGYFWGRHVMRTAQGADLAVVVEVPPGARLRSVLGELARQDVLRHPDVVYVFARLRKQTQVKTGTYKVMASQTPEEILRTLREGRVLLERVTVAEGLNRWQVRDILVHKQWMTPAQFEALCDDGAFLKASHLPGPSCEGFLFPETYTFARGTSPKEIFSAFFAAYRAQIKKAMAQMQGPVKLNEREFVTLASIVEKETGAPHERPHIACVFYNRMLAKPPWKLETDPTVIYAATLLDPKFNGNLTRYHLHKMQSPYNTYMVVGLPPGPISNPGAGALAAVAKPMQCPDYFFVSKNHGEHIFCPTLQCHLAGVKTYQIDYFRRAKAGLPLPTDGAEPPPVQAAPPPARRRAVREVHRARVKARAPGARKKAAKKRGAQGPSQDESFEDAWQ